MDKKVQGHIIQIEFSIKKALEYYERGGHTLEDDMVIDAIAKRVEQVTEISKHGLPAEAKILMPNIPWKEVSGMRDILAHQYVKLNLAVLREVLEVEFPQLLDALQEYIVHESSEELGR